MNTPHHLPVLLNQVIEAYEPVTLRVMIDGTVGAGGHASALLKAHPEIELFIGIDQDKQALAIASETLSPWKDKVVLKHGNFSQFESFLLEEGVRQVDGILVDLGVSSMQLDQPERGFSFMRDGPLDMRMNLESKLTAANIVNQWSEEELGKIFRDFGEEKRWRLAARTIIEERKQREIATTADLVNVLKPVLGNYSKKGFNPVTLIFQALRICVNQELEVLEKFLPKAISYLSPAGRLAVISFHRLEDRLVKSSTRQAASDKWDTAGLGGLFRNKTPTVKIISKKPLEATEEESRKNPRSRSAKLRIVEKLEGEGG